MAPLIPKELWLLEHFTSLEYYGRMRDAWEQVVSHNEECLSRYMQNLPAYYRNRRQFEQPDIVWGEKVLPNFRSTLRGLMDGYIRLSHGDYSALNWASGPTGDLRGVKDSWEGWMSQEEQKTYWSSLGKAADLATPIVNTYWVLWDSGNLSGELSEKNWLKRLDIKVPARWPNYRVISSITVETNERVPKTGLYLPKQEDSCAAFLIEGREAHHALVRSPNAQRGHPQSQDEATIWTHVERVADGSIEPAPSLIGESRMRVEGDNRCPKTGYWFTPARPGSRRRFDEGEMMPAFDSTYGLTIWQWDQDQIG